MAWLLSGWIRVSSLNMNLYRNSEAQPTSFGIRMFVHAVEWLLHISSTINQQSRICVAGRLGNTDMTETYGYVLREIKVCWTEF